MGRVYSAGFNGVSCSAIQDLVSVLLASPHYGEINRIEVNDVDTTLPTQQGLSLELVVLAGATLGSGGSVIAAPPQQDAGDAAANASCHVNDTAPATGSSSSIVWNGGCNLYQGLDHTFNPPIPFGDGYAVSFKLAAAPSAACKLSGTVTWTEKGK
jgi:hypothetical protein